MRRNNCQILLSILFLSIVAVTCVQVPRTTYELRKSEILGIQFETLFVRSTLDQNLVVPSASICPPTDCQPIPVSACDFTSFATCSKVSTCAANSLCANTTLTSNGPMEWITLEENSSTDSITASAGSTLLFRFFNQRPCNALKFKVTPKAGKVQLLLSKSAPTEDLLVADNSFISSNTISEMHLCPGETLFQTGTYFLTLKVVSTSTFTVSVSSTLVVPAPDYGIMEYCDLTDVPSDYDCINDGEIVSVTSGTPTKHIYTLLGEPYTCYNFSLSLKTTSKPYATSHSVYLQYLNQSLHMASPQVYDLASEQTTDDYLLFAICTEGSFGMNIFIHIEPSGGAQASYNLMLSYHIPWDEHLQPVHTLPIYTGLQSLLKSSYFVSGNSSAQKCIDKDQNTCLLYWPVFPAKGSTFAYPATENLLKLTPGREFAPVITHDSWVTGQVYEKEYWASIVLSYTVDGFTYTLHNWTSLDEISLFFPGTLLGENDATPLIGQVRAQPTETKCLYNSFKAALETTIQFMNSSVIHDNGKQDSDYYIFTYYQLGNMQADGEWWACSNYVQSFLSKGESITIEKETTACTHPIGSAAFLTDPCCSSVQGWKTTCTPRLVNVTIAGTPSVKNALVESSCANPQCTATFLDDSTQLQTDLCEPETNNDDYQIQLVEKYRQCKADTLYPSSCLSDSDCSTGVLCNLVSKKCSVPHLTLQQNFVHCLVESLDSAQIVAISDELNLPKNATKYLIEQTLLTEAFVSDCVDFTDSQRKSRTHYELHNTNTFCSKYLSCPEVVCDDKDSCEIPENTCLTQCGEYILSKQTPNNNQALCGAQQKCNWNSALGASACVDSSLSSDFCGVCDENGQNCIVTNIQNRTQCASSFLCSLADGSTTITSSQAECSALQKCTQPCPMQCKSSLTMTATACYVTNATSCNGGALSGSTCVYSNATTAAQCQALQGQFADCSSLSITACSQCEKGDMACVFAQQSAAKCFVDTAPTCATKQECESFGGICSDRVDYFPPQPYSVLGGCITSRINPSPTNSYSAYKYPLCSAIDRSLPASQCSAPYLFNSFYCLMFGGHWQGLANSRQECEAHQGCLDHFDEINTLGVQFAYSSKNYDNCTSAYNTNGQWGSYYKWTGGEWRQGQATTLTWTKRAMTSSTQWEKTLDHQRLMDLFGLSAKHKKSMALLSYLFCKYTRSVDFVNSVSCDCSLEDALNIDGTCFDSVMSTDNTSPKIAVGDQCFIDKIPFSNGQFEFASAHDQGTECTFADILFTSVLNFKGTKKQRLNTAFAPTKDLPDYSVTNDNGAVVGLLIGDGVVVQLTNANNDTAYTLCLNTRQSIDALSTLNDYPIYDFAFETSDGLLHPLGVTNITVSKGPLFDTVCAQVLPGQDTSLTLMPMRRIENYQSKPYEVYSTKDLGLIYTLAVLFLLGALYTFSKLVLVFIRLFTRVQNHFTAQNAMLVFCLAYLTIRCIYFFLLPKEVESAAVNYTLVVLPTFFYFSAFSMILIVWGVMTASTQETVKSGKTGFFMKVTAAIINGVLYTLFVAIVLLYNYLESSPPNCAGNRVQSEGDYNSDQKIVSYVYAGMIALISLVIGIALAVLGNKMKGLVPHTFKVAIFCSVCAILHSVMIIVQVAVSDIALEFSFVFLIVTEIISAVIIIEFFVSYKLLTTSLFSTSSTSTIHHSSSGHTLPTLPA